MLCFRRPDYRRWGSAKGFEEWWDERTVILAALVPRGARVLEFGAGRRQLERYLPAECDYVPSDLVDRGQGTLVCDLNRRPLPDLGHIGPTVAVFGGVVEYIADVPSLVRWLAASGIHTAIVSFDAAPSGRRPRARLKEAVRRRHNGYMNSLTEDQLIEAFKSAGMMCAEKRAWKNQGVYRFVRE